MPLAELIDMAHNNPTIKNCSSLDFHTQTRPYSGSWAMDRDIVRDGVLPNAGPELLRLAMRWRVNPENLERHTAELINTARAFFFPAFFLITPNNYNSGS